MTDLSGLNPLLQRLITLLGEPEHTPDVEGFLREYIRITARFRTDVLERAATSLVENLGKRWPSPRAVVDACVTAEEALGARPATGDGKTYPWHQQAEQARAWAEAVVRDHPIAVRAKSGGWARELRLYAQSYARERLRTGQDLPDADEFQIPRSVADDFAAKAILPEMRNIPVPKPKDVLASDERWRERLPKNRDPKALSRALKNGLHRT